MPHTARAHWEGDLKNGKGTIGLGSGAFEGPYSFKARFEGAPGTTPEELLGAAHAGCFTMALSLGLTTAGHPPTSLDTIRRRDARQGRRLVRDHAHRPHAEGRRAGLSESEFKRLAEDAKKNCIVSRAIANVPMTLDAHAHFWVAPDHAPTTGEPEEPGWCYPPRRRYA